MKDAAADIAVVCAAFGFGVPVGIERVTTGYLNRNEAVTLADRRLFLKGSRHRDPRVIVAEHAVIRHAAARGIPTPLPLIAPDGRSVVVVDGVPWSAFPFVAGTMLAGADLPERLGTLLAQVHRALASCPTAGLTFAEGALAWDSVRTHTAMATIEEHIAARVASGSADAFDRFTIGAFATLREVLQTAPLPTAFAALPVQVIHGDCYPPNILCGPAGHPMALLDWEFATLRPRAWDIARALAFTFFGLHGAPPDLPAARRCVAAYRAVQPLPDDELAAGLALYHWRTAHNIIKYRWHDERGPQPTDALAPGELALTRWLHAHVADLGRYLGGALAALPPIREVPAIAPEP